MSDNIIFETKGLRDAGAAGFMGVLVVFALTGLIVTLSTGQRIGPWYAYVAAMIIFGFLTYLGVKQHSVILQFIDKKEEGIIAAVTGPDTRNNVKFRVDSYAHWCHTVFRSPRKGGPETRLHRILTSAAGKHIHLKAVVLPGKAPKNWKDESRAIPKSEATFIVDNLAELANVLAGFKE
jgi:hypothetical protein